MSSSLLRHDMYRRHRPHLGSSSKRPAARYATASPAGTAPARRQAEDSVCGTFERMRRQWSCWTATSTWLQSDDDRRMIRTLDGNVRAVLSDHYRRLDNFDLAEACCRSCSNCLRCASSRWN